MDLQFGEMRRNPQGNQQKYKTMMCKHYNTPKGCSYGEKCQFAHGMEEMRESNGKRNPVMMGSSMTHNEQKKGANPQNYKIVKCKLWEKEGECRYGARCLFAHGDQELRSKSDNIHHNQGQGDSMNNNQMPMSMGMNNQPFGNEMNPMMMGYDQNNMFAMQAMMNYGQMPQGNNEYFMNMQQQPQMPMMGQQVNQNYIQGMMDMHANQYDDQGKGNM